MASIIEALDGLAGKLWCKEWQNPAWKQFLLTGDTKLLNFIPKFRQYSWLPNELLLALPVPDQMTETEQRFLQACVTAGLPQALGAWLRQSLPDESAQRAQFAKAHQLAEAVGCSKADFACQVTEYVRPLRGQNETPTPAGEFLLSLDEKMLGELVAKVCLDARHAPELTQLYALKAPDRWKRLLEQFREPAGVTRIDTSAWVLPLMADPKRFLEPAARAFELNENWYARFALGSALRNVDGGRFQAPMERLCGERLLAEDTLAHKRLWKQSSQAAEWLVANSGRAALRQLEQYIAAPLDADVWTRKTQGEHKNAALTLAAQEFKRDVIPLFESCFATPQPEVQLHALKLWLTLKTPEDTTSIATKLRLILASEDAACISRAARLAGELNPESVESDLWPLLAHKSRPVRDAAAGTLARLGESRLSKAKELWSVRRADARIATVTWLQTLSTPAAATELKSRLEEEEADDVRDAILLALDKISGGTVKADPKELRARIEKTVAKLAGPPADWLDPKQLPAAMLKDGSRLSSEWLLYLLYRQSRVKEMRADIEARPVFAMLDRQTTGDLALSVVQAFFGSKADADDRWAMAFAALVGNDRLVPVFARQIKDWADSMRGKLAEYAVQALALLGTDSALLAVDAMAIRYRSKNKNIGKAATEAFAEAAAARGLTVEELGDLVVPWLGFKPGETRTVNTGKLNIEARINNDFKLVFRDATTNKKISKVPDSVSTEIKDEFKELSAGLKEAVKSQLLRMETLMVRQFRWPAARWQELYLQHPLLLPFAQRLVWGTYDSTGKLTGTFRALEDQSLTNSADEPFTIPTDGLVGITHPLELGVETRQAWLKHLADYDIVPPFAQLERPVVTVKPDQKPVKFGKEVAGTSLNGMTFKGRAERLGWGRGSVCDGGGINFYLKTFPAADVDVFLETEGMYVGIDMYTDITLGKIFFTKHGSVQIGGYTYDEPGDQQDARLVPFGEAPAIAFSEAMGDLSRIAGKDKLTAEETTEQ